MNYRWPNRQAKAMQEEAAANAEAAGEGPVTVVCVPYSTYP